MSNLKTTARLTGGAYLGLAVFGMISFLVVRSQLFVDGDPSATLANLTENPTLARIGIIAELGTVVFQCLVALMFFKLFRSVSSWAAGALAAFGFVNAIMILISGAFLATALDVALDPALAADQAATTQLMYEISNNAWGVGAVFFGLWLVPMGYLIIRSGWMPRLLGWLLIAGGAGYLASAVAVYLNAPSVVAEVLTAIPSAGEFWILGYLLIVGVRREALTSS